MNKNLKVILGIVLVCLLVFSLITICIVTKKTADKNINNTNSANSNISSVKDSNTSNTNTTNNNTNNTTYQSQEFIRTYTVEKIIHGQEENSYYLTLSIFQGDVDTVLVDLSDYSLEEGRTYDFKFSKKNNIEIDDTIDSIFKNCNLTSITVSQTYQSQEFVRTYTVEKIIHGQEENSYYLTLSIFQGDVDTVLVDLSGYSLKEGKTYEFKFSKDENAVIEDNIKSIFKNCTIKSITKTNKVGLEQEQDAINLPK